MSEVLSSPVSRIVARLPNQRNQDTHDLAPPVRNSKGTGHCHRSALSLQITTSTVLTHPPKTITKTPIRWAFAMW